ncbi:MAG TPA: prephenate dehydrogenase/arogenate dehydrogenase family protein [Candidatus Polarisedimenticolaceae bacterium]|nr:prephenate dehydrogenase/arogenate dehydrogenase family protein [Candidatus Polarisedimenticolaceae bacterium]
MSRDRIDQARTRIAEIDRELIARAAERLRLGRTIGELKRGLDLPTVDYTQERAVLDRARAVAAEHGVDPEIAVDLCAVLIRAAVSAQDEDRVRSSATGKGQRAVVLGGAGRMGRWFMRFLSAEGFRTASIDPAGPPDDADAATADLVLCATPPAATAALYREWSSSPPSGVIVDIASIKSPLLEPIAALRRAGARVASMHPMFGPSVVLLRDADVVVCDTGDAEAGAAVERLFAPTTARLVRMPLAEHDRIMADLLSLAHATAIAFAYALPGVDPPVRSTTFQALEALAARVVRESPDVYFEIQADNPHSERALARLRDALDRLSNAVASRNAEAFKSVMAQGRRRTEGGS